MTGTTDAAYPCLYPWRQYRCLHLELADEEAAAFAQWLKRAGLSHYRPLAIDDDEAYLMRAAAEQVRAALTAIGFAPR